MSQQSPTGSVKAGSLPPAATFTPGPDASAAHATSLPAGTPIAIELSQVIDSESWDGGLFVLARVSDEVRDPAGVLAIPEGTNALLVVRGGGRSGTHSRLLLGLNRIQVGTKVFKTGEGGKDMASVLLDEDSKGESMHRSVHLSLHTRLVYKLDSAVQLH